MRLGRSWDVPDEFWRLWWRCRQLRRLVMQADVEPAGKSRAGKRSAPEFQRQVMDQMERYGRYPMTGPVALDLHFQAAQRNPPGIQRAAKHTLDILGAPLPGCERPRRRSVLYHDDRQIKFLYVELDQSWRRNGGENGRPGSVFIVARAPAMLSLTCAWPGASAASTTTRTTTRRSGRPTCLTTLSRTG